MCLTVSLNHCLTVSLYHCIIVSLSHCITLETWNSSCFSPPSATSPRPPPSSSTILTPSPVLLWWQVTLSLSLWEDTWLWLALMETLLAQSMWFPAWEPAPELWSPDTVSRSTMARGLLIHSGAPVEVVVNKPWACYLLLSQVPTPIAMDHTHTIWLLHKNFIFKFVWNIFITAFKWKNWTICFLHCISICMNRKNEQTLFSTQSRIVQYITIQHH